MSGVKGMNDLMPEEAALWQSLEGKLTAWLASYGYSNFRTPVLERTALFKRGIGEATDIVEKEMFSFTDRLNGDELTMRPEFTAGIVRATVEHNLLYNGPRRVFSVGPVFRHERPQRGRYRQFHQIDVEALGFAGPDIDAELIIMLARLWRDLGLAHMRLEINSLGNANERLLHRAALIRHFEDHADLLDEDARRRLHSNPLRILDSKNPEMQDLTRSAPVLADYLGAASIAHFDELKAYLDDARITYVVNPRMVRGLDYYNLTVFEWITDHLGAQGTVCGGGRYDGLIELFGGKPAPAVGFAIGVERLVDLIRQQGEEGALSSAACDVYIAHNDSVGRPPLEEGPSGDNSAIGGRFAARLAFRVAEDLRDGGIKVVLHCGGGSFKGQLKKADACGARYAIIIGPDEAGSKHVSVKSLRGEPLQERVFVPELRKHLLNKMKMEQDI